MNCISRPLKLYVIGNGFDLHHGMPCGYVDFIAWLQENRHEVYNGLNRIYGDCSGNNWSDFENSLRGFNLDDYPDNVTRDGLMQLKAGLNETLLAWVKTIGMPYIFDKNWNEHYVAASDDAELTAQYDILIDSELKHVINVGQRVVRSRFETEYECEEKE